jgi:hypothetical protein
VPRHAAFRSLLGIAATHQPFPLQNIDLTGSSGIRLSRRLAGTSRSSLIRQKASLIGGFNSLLGHNYFPTPFCREF